MRRVRIQFGLRVGRSESHRGPWLLEATGPNPRAACCGTVSESAHCREAELESALMLQLTVRAAVGRAPNRSSGEPRWWLLPAATRSHGSLTVTVRVRQQALYVKSRRESAASACRSGGYRRIVLGGSWRSGLRIGAGCSEGESSRRAPAKGTDGPESDSDGSRGSASDWTLG